MSEAELNARPREDGAAARRRATRCSRPRPRSAACSSSIPARARANRPPPSAWCCAASATACGSAIVQFVKGAWETGERDVLAKISAISSPASAMGEGFTWETQDRAARHRRRARRLGDGEGDDRRPGATGSCCSTNSTSCCATTTCRSTRWSRRCEAKPRDLHVVVTGRNAKPELIEIADLVTEMTLVKHPFRAGRQGAEGDRVLTPAAVGR